jgi:hypothetical protein
VFTSGKGENLTSLEESHFAKASSKKFKHSVDLPSPIVDSSETAVRQSEVMTAPAYHIKGMSHFL